MRHVKPHLDGARQGNASELGQGDVEDDAAGALLDRLGAAQRPAAHGPRPLRRAPVVAESVAPVEAFVVEERPVVGARRRRGRALPDADRAVQPGRADRGAVVAPGNVHDRVGVVAERQQVGPGDNVPDAGREVGSPRDQPGAVGAEGQRLDLADVPLEFAQHPAAFEVVQGEGGVERVGRGDETSGPADGVRQAARRRPAVDLVPRRLVPDEEVHADGRGPVGTGRDEAAAVGREGGAEARAGQPAVELDFAGRRVPGEEAGVFLRALGDGRHHRQAAPVRREGRPQLDAGRPAAVAPHLPPGGDVEERQLGRVGGPAAAAADGQTAPVRAEGEAVQPLICHGQPPDLALRRLRLEVPEHHLVPRLPAEGGGGGQPAVGAEGDGRRRADVAEQGQRFLTALAAVAAPAALPDVRSDGLGQDDPIAHVPDARLVVGAEGDEAVGPAEGHPVDLRLVAAQHQQRLAGLRVPDAHGGVLRARGDPLAVRAEGGRVDAAAVAAQLEDRLLRLQVPDADHALAAGRRQPLAVGAEGDLAGLPEVAGDVEHGSARDRVPDADAAVAEPLGEEAAVGADGDALADRDAAGGGVVQRDSRQPPPLGAGAHVVGADFPVEEDGEEFLAVGEEGEATGPLVEDHGDRLAAAGGLGDGDAPPRRDGEEAAVRAEGEAVRRGVGQVLQALFDAVVRPPGADGLVVRGRHDEGPVRRQGRRQDGLRMSAEGDGAILEDVVEEVPLPAAAALVGALEELAGGVGAAGRLPLAQGQVDRRGVKDVTGLFLLLLQLGRGTAGLVSRLLRPRRVGGGADAEGCRGNRAGDEGDGDRGERRGQGAVAAAPAPGALGSPRGPSQDGDVVEEAAQVVGQRQRRGVAAYGALSAGISDRRSPGRAAPTTAAASAVPARRRRPA